LVGAARVLARLDQRDGCDLAEPFPLRRCLREGDHAALNLGVADLLASRARFLAEADHVVEHNPRAPEGAGQRGTLKLGRIDAVTVTGEHGMQSIIWPMTNDGDY